MAYLTLVYLMNIPEDTKREAVRLVAPALRDVDATRVEEGFSGECFLGSKEGKRGYEEYENVCIFRAKYCCKDVSLFA